MSGSTLWSPLIVDSGRYLKVGVKLFLSSPFHSGRKAIHAAKWLPLKTEHISGATWTAVEIWGKALTSNVLMAALRWKARSDTVRQRALSYGDAVIEHIVSYDAVHIITRVTAASLPQMFGWFNFCIILPRLAVLPFVAANVLTNGIVGEYSFSHRRLSKKI